MTELTSQLSHVSPVAQATITEPANRDTFGHCKLPIGVLPIKKVPASDWQLQTAYCQLLTKAGLLTNFYWLLLTEAGLPA